ncbi:MAG TPA: SRPBCC domain-containing protein [Solirubrobacteraceae bacterium]|nr:SRPBCC domain-containing protein [Solirubrobacteraceae bacterium]
MAAERSRTEAIVEHEVRVAASPESLFDYFTDPAKMVEWMGTEATLDPRPGGVCRINPSGQAAMLGEFVEVDRPRRVVFTWGWETALFKTPPQSTLVEVSLIPEGENTVVRLTHGRLKPEAVALHRAGWHHYLARLALAASGADPGRDPWRDLPLSVEDLRAAGVLPE